MAEQLGQRDSEPCDRLRRVRARCDRPVRVAPVRRLLDDLDTGQSGHAVGPAAHEHFVQAPADWGNPEQQITSRQFFEVLDACTNKLPATQGRLFLMREWLELSSEEICKELNLTPTNLYVQLHRARLRLRECLELNWFASPKAT